MNIHLESEYVVVSCGKSDCDQRFAMYVGFYNETRRTGQTWWCPRGHARHWAGDTTEQKLKKAEARSTHLEDQLRATEGEAEKVRVRLLRDRHRFANGVCPCCNRVFTNVARHMSTQHPDYDPADLRAEPRYECSCGQDFGTLRGLRVHQGRMRPDDYLGSSMPKWRAHLTVIGA